MNALQTAFNAYLQATEPKQACPQGTLGPKQNEPVSEEEAIRANQQLDKKLRDYYVSNNCIFIIIVTLFVILFFFGLYLIVLYRDSPGQLEVIFSGTGVFIVMSGLIKLMFNTLRYKFAMDIILAIAPSLSTDDLRSLVTVASSKLFK